MSKKIRMYRSISMQEYAKLLLGIPIDGSYNPLHIRECGNNGYYGKVVCAFEDEIKWHDNTHDIFITLEIDESKIIGKEKSYWYMPQSFAKTKTYRGRQGNEYWELNEYYLKQYSILDVVNVKFLSEEFNKNGYTNYEIMYSLKMAMHHLVFKSMWLNLQDYTSEDVIFRVNELIDKFPETNTLIKKDDYTNALFELLYNSFGFNYKEKIA